MHVKGPKFDQYVNNLLCAMFQEMWTVPRKEWDSTEHETQDHWKGIGNWSTVEKDVKHKNNQSLKQIEKETKITGT